MTSLIRPPHYSVPLRKISPIYMGGTVFKLHTPMLKYMPLYIGKVLRTPLQNPSHIYRKSFVYLYAKTSITFS